jgi:hypothetical protein
MAGAEISPPPKSSAKFSKPPGSLDAEPTI